MEKKYFFSSTGPKTGAGKDTGNSSDGHTGNFKGPNAPKYVPQNKFYSGESNVFDTFLFFSETFILDEVEV